MRIKYLKFKNFVRRHKMSIAVAGTAGTCLYLNSIAMKQHDDFLKEKGLYEEFYSPED